MRFDEKESVMMQTRAAAVILLGVLVVGTPFVSAQTTGTISGHVQDETGAVLPTADVVVTNLETSVSRATTADEQGRYRVTNLNIGQYEVTASMSGFQTAVRRGIALTIGREAVVDLTLRVGDVSEDVTVTGDAPLVDTRGGALGAIVDRDTIMEIPLSGRDLTGLITLQSGTALTTTTTTGTSQGFSNKFSIGGSRVGDNSVLLDGTEVRSYDQGVPAGVSGNFLGGEAIQEFKVEKNSFSAEFGGAAGGVINVVSKAGGNDFRGSGYGFFRNDALDATNFRAPAILDSQGQFIGKQRPDFWRAQYGASAGGRIVRNRTFYFANWEGMRERLNFPEYWTTLSADGRRGILGTRRVQVNPLMIPYFDLWPLPADAQDLGDGTARFSIVSQQPTDEDFYQIRGDHNFSPSDVIFGRVTRQVSSRITPAGRNTSISPRWAAKDEVYNTFVTVEHRKIITNRLLNTFRFGFNRRGISTFTGEDPPVDPALFMVPPDKWSAPLGAKQTMGQINVSGIGSVGVFSGWVDRRTNRTQFTSNGVYTRGPQTFKFGADWTHVRLTGNSPASPAGQLTFASVEALLQGLPRQFRGGILPGVDYLRDLRWNTIGLYGQLDWQINSRLTANLGLRNDFYTVPTEKDGKFANLKDPLHDTDFTAVGERGDSWWENPGTVNLSPRLGVSWDLTGSGRTAVRAGAGIFHNLFQPEAFRQYAWRSAPYALETNIQTAEGAMPFPVGLYDWLIGLGASQGEIHLFPYDYMGKPRLVQFNVNIQHEIMANTAITVGYAGSRGYDLPDYQSLNTAEADVIDGRYVFPANARRPNPAYNLDLGSVETSAQSWYNSLQVEVQRRFQAGWQMQVAYTWSKSVDHASSYTPTFGGGAASGGYVYDHNLAKGLSAFHVGQRLSASALWQLPGIQSNQLMNAIFGGWQLSGIVNVADGPPISVSIGADANLSALGLSAQKPDLIPGGDHNPVIGDPDAYFDVTQFVMPPARTIGNLGRNTLIGPGLATVDLGFTKNIPLAAARTQVRIEVFNLLNRANLGTPSTQVFNARGVRQAGVGFIGSTTTTARQVQLGLRLDW
jgi:outer membrane receptor protein involved in Fe transport